MTEQTIQSMMGETRKFEPPAELKKNAWIKSMDEYKKLWDYSIREPEKFWAERAEQFIWFKKWTKVRSYDFKNKIEIKYYDGGLTNLSVNCLDRWVKRGKGAKTAIIWEGNEPKDNRRFTYQELLDEVSKFANVLKGKGVKKGDRITIYMPMVPELAIAMLACARIGAVHSVVFGGFSAASLSDRILNCGSDVLITTDGGFRGAKGIETKAAADEAMRMCCEKGHNVRLCIVSERTGEKVEMKKGRDFFWSELMKEASKICEPEKIGAEDPLFILYTSGSTGKPKGVLHTTGGYMVFAADTFKYMFDYHDDDIFWCTADIGWVTGHTYIVYGPLLTCATEVMFEGIPNYPEPDRFWEVCEKHKVTIFYTAPTAIRALMKEGESWPAKHDLSSLRILGTVGEPINPEAWMWYHKNIGHEKCPIVDTWWQTETGGALIAPLPGAVAAKPGSAAIPFFGVKPKILREDGSECAVNEGGYLVIEEPWPGIMRTVYGHHERFKETYFTRFPGVYFTGDGARLDEDGYFWLMGRVDDVINISGHRIGTAEVESSLVSHPKVAEAAVVGYPHEIKGEALYAYITLKTGNPPSDELKKELAAHVRKQIGPIAVPDKMQFADSLPKTRSGKIMRRILRNIAKGDVKNLGDTTTLADPNVVNALVEGRQ